MGLDGRPASDTGIEQITANMTCTNGDLPRTIRASAPNGDLVNEQGAIVSRIDMLDAPTAVSRLPQEGDAVWRLIAQLAPHSIELTRSGLAELKRLLRQFAVQSGTHANLIDGLTNLGHRVRQLWLSGEPMPSFVRGLEVTLTVDEQAFAATSLNAFVGVMERFFTAHMSATNFVQLVVMSANNGRKFAAVRRDRERRRLSDLAVRHVSWNVRRSPMPIRRGSKSNNIHKSRDGRAGQSECHRQSSIRRPRRSGSV